MQKAAADIANWSYSVGDGEATFLGQVTQISTRR